MSAIWREFVAVCLLAVAGSSSCASAEPTSSAQWKTAQLTFLAWNAARNGWATTPDGLQYRRLSPQLASAPQPRADCPVQVNYEGRLIDGELFDASSAHDGPLTFSLAHVIRGWREGLLLMHMGETFEFVVPANLAYGSKWFVQDGKPFVSIPADSTLIFEIKLVALPTCQRPNLQ